MGLKRGLKTVKEKERSNVGQVQTEYMIVSQVDGGRAFEVIEGSQPTGRFYRMTDDAEGNAADGLFCWDLRHGERVLKVRVAGGVRCRLIDDSEGEG